MSTCRQPAISDAAFSHLSGIHTLNMSFCRQPGITDLAFSRLAGIHTLYMSGCSQATVTDAAIGHLAGIQLLDMQNCYQLTEAAVGGLSRGTRVNMTRCRKEVIAAAVAKGLQVVC